MSDETNITNVSGDSGENNRTIKSKQELLLRKFFLKKINIGISISESDNLSDLGYGTCHLKDAIIEIARYIVVAGGNLVYGGDMRNGGFTELIFDLLAYYKGDKELQPSERFYSYLAYPLSTKLTVEKEAELIHNVSFIKTLPPEDLDINSNEYIEPNSIINQYVWARSLSKMREEMESHCNARVFIGGRTKGFKGICPGILEEFLIAIEHSHPIYLIGAFGGITKDVIDSLNGKVPDIFSDHYYSNDEEYMSLYNFYNEKHPLSKIDYNKYYTIINELGWVKLSELNGLSIAENIKLSSTPHINEAIYLIMKGLTTCFTR